MAVSVQNYTNRFIVVTILVVMAMWALLFYTVLMDEVYDNVDNGLKNQKIEIIREAFVNPTILTNSTSFGVNQFRITAADKEYTELDRNHFTKEMVYMPYDEEEEPYRVLKTGFYSKDGKPYLLEIRTSTVEEDDHLINIATSLGVLYLVIILSIFIVNQYVLSRAWKPFRMTLKNLSRYRFGDTKSFVAVPSDVKEFQELNQQIVHMIDRNEQVFAGQKLFLENAAHELQTPLAVTINKLALLMDDADLNETQLVKIAEAKGALHRMVTLNRSLLMLSRIDNNQYTTVEEVNFNDLVKTLMVELEDVAEFKEVRLELVEKSVFTSLVNPDLAYVLLANLLRNAIKYNVVGGEVVVIVEEDKIILSNCSHSGALNPDYIFERFYKGSQDHNSNGLGLSIVRSILDKQTVLALTYAYVSSQHVFTLMKKILISNKYFLFLIVSRIGFDLWFNKN